MFKKMVVPAILLASALAFGLTPSASAAGFDRKAARDHGRLQRSFFYAPSYNPAPGYFYNNAGGYRYSNPRNGRNYFNSRMFSDWRGRGHERRH